MKKFFATLAVLCLCAFGVSAVENQNTSSELKSTSVSEMTVGAYQGQATEYVFSTPAGTTFTGDVFASSLPNNVGNELCFKATSGEYFMVSLFNAQGRKCFGLRYNSGCRTKNVAQSQNR